MMEEENYGLILIVLMVVVDKIRKIGKLICPCFLLYALSGNNSVKWDGKDFSSGLYFVRIQVGLKVYNQKSLLVK